MGRARKYDEQLLVVVGPWPASGPKHEQFVNNVSSWFEVMLREDNPCASLKVEAIYQQKTHPNIIVELPAEANIEHLLGAHHWGVFLKEPHKSRWEGLVSYVYEYNYDAFHHPSRINWYAGIPTYMAIDPTFPVLSPYPLPGPAPAPRLPYAINLPKHLRINRNAAPAHDPHPVVPAEVDDAKKDKTADAPLPGPGSKLGKMDPYEEEEKSINMLRPSAPRDSRKDSDLITNSRGAITRVKVESTNNDYIPSLELVLSAEQYLSNVEHQQSTSVTVKREVEDDYQPSTELRTAIAKFQAVEVKREENPKKNKLSFEAHDDEPATKRVKREYS
ncbi:hypothetical protein F5887DRAFT_1277946 [Amanita rubescens]|nr:hypothetical protein F5887DRAFT_1277946 [Amanita rubescens]